MHGVWFIHTGSTKNTWNRTCVEECGEKNNRWIAVISYSPLDSLIDRVTKRPPLFQRKTQVLPAPCQKPHTVCVGPGQIQEKESQLQVRTESYQDNMNFISCISNFEVLADKSPPSNNVMLKLKRCLMPMLLYTIVSTSLDAYFVYSAATMSSNLLDLYT